MPPSRWLKSPACAKPQAMAIEPRAVTIHESREMAPTWAMLLGSMMMPEPIMFTATMNVSCTTFIFLAVAAPVLTVPAPRSPPDRVGEELDAVIDPLLIDALDLVVEAGKTVERLLKRHEVVEHRLGPIVPPLTGHHDADAGGIDQRQRRSDPALDLLQRDVVHCVRDQGLVRVLGRHRERGEALGAEAAPLQLLDVGRAIEPVHLVADPAEGVPRVAVWIPGADVREDGVERGILVPEILELDQLGEQRVELALVLRRGREERAAGQVALLRDDVLLAQVVGDYRGRHPEVEVCPGAPVDAGRQQRELVR